MVSAHQSKKRRATGFSVSSTLSWTCCSSVKISSERIKRGQRGSRSIAVQNADHFIHFGRADRAVVDRAQLVRTRLPITEAAVRDVELRAIAIAPGLAGNHPDFGGRLDLAEAAELFRQNRALGRELIVVRRVLIVAAAAAGEVRAGRRDALRRGLERLRTVRARMRPGLLLLGLDQRPAPPAARGANTTRPSRRASPSPPYTSFSTLLRNCLR